MTDGFNKLEMPRELGMGWHTTNGFDVIWYLSDGSMLEVMEKESDGWEYTNLATGEVVTVATRSEGVKLARDYIASVPGLRAVPSTEQAAAPWFRGTDYDYTKPDREERRQWITRAPAIKTTATPKPEPVAPSPAPAAVDPVAQLNAMLTAYRLNALMNGPEKEWHCDRCKNSFGGNVPVCPECGGSAHA